MTKPVLDKRKFGVIALTSVTALLAMAFVLFGDDIHRHNLDPKVPFQTYRRPAAAIYDAPSGWYLNPALTHNSSSRKVDVFFVHATSFTGKQWLSPIDDRLAGEDVVQMQLPNYAAPFAAEGNVYAPRYRQASLYTMMTQREDAREARQFAYADVERAFEAFLQQRRSGKGLVLVGVEQGGLIVERLLKNKVLNDPELSSQFIVAYIIETIVPASAYSSGGPLKACLSRAQTGCVVAYMSVDDARPDQALQAERKALIWGPHYGLIPLGKERALCVNPLTGGATDENIDAKQSLGAANATGLEWDTPPALVPRKVTAKCRGGMLYVTKPSSPTFNDASTWISRKKVNSYNLFYGDIKTDFRDRVYNFPYNKKSEKA